MYKKVLLFFFLLAPVAMFAMNRADWLAGQRAALLVIRERNLMQEWGVSAK